MIQSAPTLVGAIPVDGGRFLVSCDGGIELFPDDVVGGIGLGGGTDGLGVAVAEGDDARAVVAADEAAIANFGLAEGVGFTACGGEFDFIRKAGFSEKGGAGGLAEGDEAFSVELGVDAKSEVGAGGLIFGVLGGLEIEEATFLVKATGFGAVVAGGEGACEDR